MDELPKQAGALQKEIDEALERLRIPELSKELATLQAASQQPDFWDDSTRAQDTMKQISKLEARVQPWQELQKGITDINDLLQLNDASLSSELTQSLAKV